MILSDAHIHTNMCDGRDSAADMARAGSQKGFYSLGFSGHSYIPFDPQYSVKDEKAYFAVLAELKKQYAESMRIYTGIELDYFTPSRPIGYDYTIGSVHYVAGKSGFYAVDLGQKEIISCAEEMYGGDVCGVAQKYFELVAENAVKNKPDIIGHFDLIKKTNRYGALIDENSQIYKKAALEAAKVCADTGAFFEVNTGGIRRGSGLYPSEFILRQLKRLDAKLIINSDAHCKEDVGADFEETALYLKSLGFSSVYTLSGKSGNIFDKVQL